MFPHVRRQHRERVAQTGLPGGVLDVGDWLGRLRLTCDTSDVYSSVMVEVVIRGNQSIARSVLEADTIAIVNSVEALDRCYDGLCCVMCVHQNPERDPCSCFGPVIKE